MRKFSKETFGLLIFLVTHIVAFSQQSCWQSTSFFPTPSALNVYALSSNYGWCDRITVGGYSNTGSYPMFHSNDRGNSWINIGSTPIGTAYSIAQESSTLSTKYVAIRDDISPSNSGLFRYSNSTGWQLKCCGGKSVMAVIQNNQTVLCGVSGTGRGIYRSTNMGDVFTQINSNVDIYCFYAQNNTFWAGGSYPSGGGIVLKSTGYPFDNWTEVGYVDGSVIGITVNSAGNIFVATTQGKILKSTGGGNFTVCRTGVTWDIMKIPIVATGNGIIYYGDYNDGVHYSFNNGTTWNSTNTCLPQPPHIIDLTVDPCDQNLLYAAIGGSLSSHIYYRKDYLITTSSNPSDGGTTTGSGAYSLNQSATVTAVPTNYWTFENWSENGTIVSTDNPYAFQVTGNRNLIANFSPPKTINLNLFLEGLYLESGMMHPAMNGTGYQWDASIADRINIELHSGSNYSNIIYSTQNIDLNTSGTASFLVYSTYNGDYYVTIINRNHILTTTSSPVSFTSSIINYNFDNPSTAYGGNMKQMSDGRYVFYAGDENQDGSVDGYDLADIGNLVDAFATGYISGDINGDGTVDGYDMSIAENNIDAFVTEILPE
jgi:hypothetical protein